MANTVTSNLKAMTAWAARTGAGDIEVDPLAGAVKRAEEGEPDKRALNNEEIVLFLRNLDSAITENPRKRILKAITIRRILLFILYTGCRPGEACGLLKSEIEGDTFSMTDPFRCKNREKHHFHLSAPAREIVKAAIADAPKGKYVFPLANKMGFPHVANIDNAVSRAVRPSAEHPRGRFGIAPFSPHDLRKTILDGLERLKVPPHVTSAIAAHKSALNTVTKKHYSSYLYTEERAAALDLWADHIARLLDPGKVVAIPKAA